MRARARFFFVSALGLLAVACASSPKPKREPAKIAAPIVLAAPAEEGPSEEELRARSSVKIKGLTGTLNKDDVHQTMEARQPELDTCIAESRKRLRWISGAIRFAFKVDAEGVVEDVHAIESNIGHHALESCIHTVLAETIFPKPAGLATAEFDWGLTVVPAAARMPDVLEPEALDRVLHKRVPKILEHCEVRRRERFTVTAYITTRGRVVSVGAVPKPARAAEKLECVLEELASLRMPKQPRQSKVTFELR